MFLRITRSGAFGFRRRWLFPALLLTLLGACSFSFYYRHLDWLIPWQLSDYVNIDDQQHSELERRLMAKLEWHCSTQLSAYAEWFREMRSEPKPFSRADLERHYQRSVEFWRVLMEKLSPDITALLLTASDSQVKELMGNLERRTRELEKRYVTAGWETVQRRRVDRMEEILRHWLGPLSREQQQTLARWAREMGHGGGAWIKSRRHWQQALGEALALRADRQRFAERIHTLFVEPRQLWPESYRQEYERLRVQTLNMLEEIIAKETPGQQRYFKEQLLSWEKDFRHLACLSPNTASGNKPREAKTDK